MKIAGFIPAKGSSTRVPAKNTQTILGIPLFLWAANNLSRVLPRADIYIDSDDDTILSQASALGFGTIKRPSPLATNDTNGNEFTLWQAQNVTADIYVQHLAPMVFLKEDTLRQAISLVQHGKHASAVGVKTEQQYTWTAEGPTYDLLNLPNSFTLPKTIIEGMGLYVMTREGLLAQKVRAASPCAHVELDCFEAVDIDYPKDLEFARAIAAGLPSDSPYICDIQKMRQKKPIKLLVLDVDGVMTDGGMYYTENGDQIKKFNTKDGMAIKMAQEANIEVAFLSSGYTKNMVADRASTLGITRHHIGREKKEDILAKWATDLKLKNEEIAYIGDDINDLHVMQMCGLTACPSNAVSTIKKTADITLTKAGGDACVREFIEEYLL